MESTTIRVPTKTHQTLKQLSSQSNQSMQEVLEQALELYRRKAMLEAASAAYAKLQQNPKQYAAWKAEMGGWDETLGDGLEDK